MIGQDVRVQPDWLRPSGPLILRVYREHARFFHLIRVNHVKYAPSIYPQIELPRRDIDADRWRPASGRLRVVGWRAGIIRRPREAFSPGNVQNAILVNYRGHILNTAKCTGHINLIGRGPHFTIKTRILDDRLLFCGQSLRPKAMDVAELVRNAVAFTGRRPFT